MTSVSGWDWKVSAKKAAVTLGIAALGAVAAVVVDPNTQGVVNASGAPPYVIAAYALVVAGARFAQDWLKNR